jgi:cell division protein FtsQ
MRTNRLKKGRGVSVFRKLRSIAILICIFTSAILISFLVYARPLKSVFPLKQIVFIGNKHLTDEELKTLSGIHRNESLIALSSEEINQRLLRSPWIKSVLLRREFPHTLSIVIREAEPFALLDMNAHLFLVDESGKLLEELKGDSVPFLPIITGDPFKEKEGFTEALKLIKSLNEKGITSEREHIEVKATKPQELTVEVDGTVVKMGTGGYEEKLAKLVRLEEDLKKMGIHVDFIDLRFEKKAIVKPVKEEAGKR